LISKPRVFTLKRQRLSLKSDFLSLRERLSKSKPSLSREEIDLKILGKEKKHMKCALSSKHQTFKLMINPKVKTSTRK